jgi:hypothetical protein
VRQLVKEGTDAGGTHNFEVVFVVFVVVVVALFIIMDPSFYRRASHLLKSFRQLLLCEIPEVLLPTLALVQERALLTPLAPTGTRPVLAGQDLSVRVEHMREMARVAESASSELVMPARACSPRSRTLDKRSRSGHDEGVQEGTGLAVVAPPGRVEELARKSPETGVHSRFRRRNRCLLPLPVRTRGIRWRLVEAEEEESATHVADPPRRMFSTH